MNQIFMVLIILLVLGALFLVCNICIKKYEVNLNDMSPKELPHTMWAIVMISAIVLYVLAEILFLNVMNLDFNVVNGLLFGLGAAIIGLILDFLVLAPHKDGLEIISQYRRHPLYLLTYILIIIICTLVGVLG